MERKRSLILINSETTYGTEPAMVAVPIITIGDPNFELITNVKERQAPTKSLGSIAPTVMYKAAKLSFKTEFKGAGAPASTPPVIGYLFKIAGMTETVNDEQGSESVEYNCSDSLETPSATVYFYHGATLHKMVGCVANLKMDLAAGDIMYLDVELQGLVPTSNIIADDTFPDPTYSTIAPNYYKSANFKFGAITDLYISKFSIDFGNEIAERPDPNSAYGINRFYVKNRSVKVSFDPEKKALSKIDPWALHVAQTETTIETKINKDTAGSEIDITVIGVTLDVPKYGERDNIITYELSGVSRVKSGITVNPITIMFQ